MMPNDYCWMHSDPFGGWDCQHPDCQGNMELINHPDLFRAYLNGLPEDIPVGFARYAGRCPLANWLRDSDPTAENCIVSNDIYAFEYRKFGWKPLPLWAIFFVSALDRKRVPGSLISKTEALAILDESLQHIARLLLPEKAESLLRCADCEEPGKVWITVCGEREETLHLCWMHFTTRFPVQRSVLPAREPEPIGV